MFSSPMLEPIAQVATFGICLGVWVTLAWLMFNK